MPAAEKQTCCAGRKTTVLLAMIGLLIGTGCTQKKVEETYLVRVKTQSVSTAEFNQAVGAAIIETFGGDRDIDIATMNDLRMRVIKQLSEEMMIVAYATDKGIDVTEEELDRAVAVIKADYPDNTFEETLLENAVSFQFWRKQMATRLLIDKVIAKELIQTVQISDEDISGYYKENFPQGLPAGEDVEAINQRVVTHLRRLKAESAYQDWVVGLREAYVIEINDLAWKDLIREAHSAH